MARAEYVKQDGKIRTPKLLWALGNYSLFVRPGMVRIQAGFDNWKPPLLEQASDLMVSAYADQHSGKLVVVLVNYGREDRTVVLPAARSETMKVFVTSDSMNLQRQTIRSDGMVIPKRSVVTLLLQIAPERPR